MKKRLMMCLLCLACLQPSAFSQLNKETPSQKTERMKWWTEARFGMFIHWGLYALPARHEWMMTYEKMSPEAYQKYFEVFNPDLYNPKEWAAYAKQAGMKYVVLTTKHHEGFCLWDTKYTDYKVTNTPIGRDLLREFVDAFRAEGIKVGFYYSLLDWHHPDFTIDDIHPLKDSINVKGINDNRNMDRYRKYMMNQLTELLTNYGDIACMFIDYSYPLRKQGKGKADWHSGDIYKLVKKLQPNLILNDRMDLLEEGGWDFRTPEQYMPATWVTYKGENVPWETCQTFSGSWGYFRDEYTWKSINQLVVMLIESVSKGGNLLLNVGPTGRGYFDPRAVERLQGMGEWMKYNARSIYGCTAAPEEIQKPENCLLTYNPKTHCLYVHLLHYPYQSIILPGLRDKVKYAQFLHDGSELLIAGKQGAWMKDESEDGKALKLTLPVQKPDVEIPVIELFLK